MKTKIQNLDHANSELSMALELLHQIRDEGRTNGLFDISCSPMKGVRVLEEMGVITIVESDSIAVIGNVSDNEEIIRSNRIYNKVNSKKLALVD